MRGGVNSPLDGKARNAGLLGQDVALNMLDERLGWRVLVHVGVVVLVVDVVADANELAAVVGARQKDHGDAQDVGIRNARGLGGLGLKDELVHADGNGAYEKGVELLVVLVAVGSLGEWWEGEAGLWVERRSETHEVAEPT